MLEVTGTHKGGHWNTNRKPLKNTQEATETNTGGHWNTHSIWQWWLFPSVWGFLVECSIIHSPHALFFFFFLKLRLARAHYFHSLARDQTKEAQQAETTVAECFLTSFACELVPVRFPHYVCGIVSPLQFVGSRMYPCLSVTCHQHFWHNDRGLLRATAVTRGWNGHRIRASTQSLLRRRNFSRRPCRNSNSQPFDHESGVLPTSYLGSK